MRKVITVLVVIALAVTATPAFAQRTTRGASTTAYEKASDEAVFHRVGDWFATVGKSDEEKQAIIAQRKAERAAKRAQKEAAKAQKEAQKKMQKTKSQMKSKWGQ